MLAVFGEKSDDGAASASVPRSKRTDEECARYGNGGGTLTGMDEAGAAGCGVSEGGVWTGGDGVAGIGAGLSSAVITTTPPRVSANVCSMCTLGRRSLVTTVQ
jgi:hypothetical protein